jgi:hypothetical protein
MTKFQLEVHLELMEQQLVMKVEEVIMAMVHFHQLFPHLLEVLNFLSFLLADSILNLHHLQLKLPIKHSRSQDINFTLNW